MGWAVSKGRKRMRAISETVEGGSGAGSNRKFYHHPVCSSCLLRPLKSLASVKSCGGSFPGGNAFFNNREGSKRGGEGKEGRRHEPASTSQPSYFSPSTCLQRTRSDQTSR
eukprot:750437-Hanusia_phi.AAC.1